MHLLADQTVAIQCPVGATYRYATDLAHFGQWFPGVLAITPVDALSPATIGKEYLETVEWPGGGQRSVRIRVREARADEWLATEGDLAPLLPRMEMRFVARGPQSCELNWRMWSRHPGDDTLRQVVWPAAGRLITERAVAGLARLKQRLEAGA
ncbi:MAG TPA: SRPBCC family protein [Burkholderiaceae bacterium]